MTNLDKFIQKSKLKYVEDLCKKPICFTDMEKIHILLNDDAKEKGVTLYENIAKRGLEKFFENPRQ